MSHAHAHPHEDYTARSHPEFVVLDIGGDVGALIVHAAADLLGTEVEISAAGEDDRRSHKDASSAGWAASRPTPPSSTACARAPTRSGAANVPRTRDVTITGGAIAEVDWRA